MRTSAIVYAVVISCVATIAGSANAGTVTTANLNLRAAPTVVADVLTVVPKDSNIIIGECAFTAKWCKASFSGSYGWVSTAFLAASEGRSEFPANAEISDARVIPDDKEWTDVEPDWQDVDDGESTEI